MSDDARMRLILELRQKGVTDGRILSAIERTPRAVFVDPDLAAQGWDDTPLPLPGGGEATAPSDVARMLTALAPGADDAVLEIGLGSGWQSAVLSRLCGRVISLERRASLAAAAREKLRTRAYGLADAYCADGTLGWPDAAPYTHVIINAAVREEYPALLGQLKAGGVMVSPVEDERGQRIVVIRRALDGALSARSFGPSRFAPIETGLAD